MSRLRADLILLLAAMIWGVAFVFQKSAMQQMGPLTFVAARSALAALCLMPLVLIERRGGQAPRTGLWKLSLLAGVVFFIAGWVQQAGIVTATVTNTGFLTALYVVMTPLAAWTWRRKPPPILIWPAVALSTLGTWLLGGGSLGAFSQGDALVAISAAFWAIHVVVSGEAALFARPISFTAVQFACVAALAACGAVLLERPSATQLHAAAIDIFYVGILSSALTFTLLTTALKHTSAPEAAVIISTDTIFAALAAYWLLGERLTPMGWAGAILIASAILLMQLGSRLAGDRLRNGRSVKIENR